MSNSIAAAKRRRAGIQEPTPVQSNSSPSLAQPQAPKMSIPNFLGLLDKRISSLESSLLSNTEPNNIQLEIDSPEGKKTMKITEYMEEMDAKFNMLAEEITNMKDIVLKLQTFTMDVNKSLLSSTSLKDILSGDKDVPTLKDDKQKKTQVEAKSNV